MGFIPERAITFLQKLCRSWFISLVLMLLASNQLRAANEIMFVIDTSGSMTENDPENLRQPALRLASQLLPAGTKAGILMFDSNTRELVPFEEVDAKWKQKATGASELIHSRGQLTNIESALEKSAETFSKDADSKSIILLTDGQVDIGKDISRNATSRQRILNQLLPDMNSQDIKIHTIALSENTDKDLMQRLSVGSNGMYSLAGTADDLMSIFLDAFDQSIAADQVPLENNAFSVDNSIHEFTVLVFRKAGALPSKLKSPGGVILTQQNPGPGQWFSDQVYDLITVPNPETGEWVLDAELDPENRVTIVSDIELNLRGLPNNIVEGQQVTLEFFLSDDKGPINEPSLLSLLDIDFEQSISLDPPKVMRAKVTSHTQGVVRTPDDGIYSARLSKTLVAGEHEFKILVDGKTFKREQSKRARVFSHVMEYTIIQSSEENQQIYSLNLVPISGLTNADSLNVIGNIKLPDGQVLTADIEKTKFGSWVMAIPPSEGTVLYKAFITVEGKTAQGDDFKVTQGPIQVDYEKPLSALQTEPKDLFASLEEDNNQAEIQEIIQATAPKQSEPARQGPVQPPEVKADITTEEKIETEPAPETQTALKETEAPKKPAANQQPVTEEPPLLEDEPAEDEATEDEATFSEDAEVEETGEESAFISGSTLMYIGIALFNVGLIGGGVFFARRWLKKKKLEAEAEDQALLDEVNKAKAQVVEKANMKPEKSKKTKKTDKADDDLAAEAAKISDMLDSIDDQDETG